MDDTVRSICLRKDADTLMDLRCLNGSDFKCFDLFWDVTMEIIEEKLKPKVRATILSIFYSQGCLKTSLFFIFTGRR